MVDLEMIDGTITMQDLAEQYGGKRIGLGIDDVHFGELSVGYRTLTLVEKLDYGGKKGTVTKRYDITPGKIVQVLGRKAAHDGDFSYLKVAA